MNRGEILDFLKREVAEMVGTEISTVNDSTHLYGENGQLNSVDLVTLVATLEQYLEDRLGRSVTLVSDRALSQRRSPFRTVGSMLDFVTAEVNA